MELTVDTPSFVKHPLAALQSQLGHVFEDQQLLEQALTHKSFSSKKNNERLEFLGDSVLGLIVADYLYRNFPDFPEGDLSRIRSALVREDALVIVAQRLKIDVYLRVTEYGFRSKTNDSSLADAVEALFAAVYRDGGLEKARLVVQNQINFLLANKHVDLKKDPKTQLQEFLQARALRVPRYEHTNNREAGHVVDCVIDELSIRTSGTGHSRKEADRSAAEKALAICLKTVS